jgi:hypothetical protein
MAPVISTPTWRVVFGPVALAGIVGFLLTIDFNIVWSRMIMIGAAYALSTVFYFLMTWYFVYAHGQHT